VEKTTTQANWKTFLQLIKDTKPPKTMITIAVAMSVLATAAGLAIPLFTKSHENPVTIQLVFASRVNR